jgi:hypothetical protein
MKTRIIFLSICNLVIVLSCQIKTSHATTFYWDNNKSEIEVVKFMYMYDYPIQIWTDNFWQNKEEHVKFWLPSSEEDNFYDFIVDSLPNYEGHMFLNYAFIIKTSKKVDTLYAEKDLMIWGFRKDGKWQMKYDKDSVFQGMKIYYPFFRDCW